MDICDLVPDTNSSNDLGSSSKKWNSVFSKKETKEEKVIKIYKSGFQDAFGMSLQEFQKTFKKIRKKNPEKLI